LYECETSSVSVREEHELRVSDKDKMGYVCSTRGRDEKNHTQF